MINFESLEEKIIAWAVEKGLTNPSGMSAQLQKTIEELGELAGADIKMKETDVIDGLGDVLVTLIILAKQNDMFISQIVDEETFEYDSTRELFGTKRNLLFGVLIGIAEIAEDIRCHIKVRPRNLQSTVYYLADFATYYQADLNSCLLAAWNEIRDRQGKTVDGVFIKE